MSVASNPHQLGPEGEELAANYLVEKGYRIIARNYRFHHKEIDIIALHQKTLCFIEVKTRLSATKGHPAEAVTLAKQREIVKVAKAYLASSGKGECDCRFDVIAIQVKSQAENQISSFTLEHFMDAFWADS